MTWEETRALKPGDLVLVTGAELVSVVVELAPDGVIIEGTSDNPYLSKLLAYPQYLEALP